MSRESVILFKIMWRGAQSQYVEMSYGGAAVSMTGRGRCNWRCCCCAWALAQITTVGSPFAPAALIPIPTQMLCQKTPLRWYLAVHYSGPSVDCIACRYNGLYQPQFKTQCNFMGMNCSDKFGRAQFLNLLNGKRPCCLQFGNKLDYSRLTPPGMET